jgi:hypothetical protein
MPNLNGNANRTATPPAGANTNSGNTNRPPHNANDNRRPVPAPTP